MLRAWASATASPQRKPRSPARTPSSPTNGARVAAYVDRAQAPDAEIERTADLLSQTSRAKLNAYHPCNVVTRRHRPRRRRAGAARCRQNRNCGKTLLRTPPPTTKAAISPRSPASFPPTIRAYVIVVALDDDVGEGAARWRKSRRRLLRGRLRRIAHRCSVCVWSLTRPDALMRASRA